MNDWKAMVRNCFGEIDRKFAIHPIDRRHAHEMLRASISAGATVAEVEAEVRSFLAHDGCSPEHIAEQIDALRRLRAHFN